MCTVLSYVHALSIIFRGVPPGDAACYSSCPEQPSHRGVSPSNSPVRSIQVSSETAPEVSPAPPHAVSRQFATSNFSTVYCNTCFPKLPPLIASTKFGCPKGGQPDSEHKLRTSVIRTICFRHRPTPCFGKRYPFVDSFSEKCLVNSTIMEFTSP